MKTDKKSFKEKLLAVAGAVKCVEKDGTNSFHKYKYATAASVMEKVKEACQTERLIITSNVVDVQETRTTAKGEDYLCKAVVRFTVSDVDSEEKLDSDFVGFGTDKGDKGVYKAYTGALKYFLFQNFQIATDDDPENEQPQKRSEPAKSVPPPVKFEGNPFSHAVKMAKPDSASSLKGRLIGELYAEKPEKLAELYNSYKQGFAPETQAALATALNAVRQGTAQELCRQAMIDEHGYEPDNLPNGEAHI